MVVADKIFEVLSTLSEDSQNAVQARCKELSYDPNKGDIPLDESFNNLNSSRLALTSSIQKNEVQQIPLTAQKAILSALETVSRHQQTIINGTDDVINLVNSIDALHTILWQSRIYNVSEEVLGYETKMNQLKNLELQALRSKTKLEEGIDLKAALENIVATAGTESAKLVDENKKFTERLGEEAQRKVDQLQALVGTSEERSTNIAANLQKATEATQKTTALLATVQQSEAVATQLLASTKTSNAEVLALEPKVKEFFSQIEQHRVQLQAMSDQAQKTVQENQAETGKLIERLTTLENAIAVQIQKATGHTLFHSFQTRKEALASVKWYWAYALAALIVASLCLSAYLINTSSGLDVAFFLKLSMTIPLIVAFTFCTIQYTRERKLEEEYAFKSNISVSLVPYQELVDKLIDKAQQGEKEKYSAFIIDAVTKVFTSPTDKVFASREKHKGFTEKTIKELICICQDFI